VKRVRVGGGKKGGIGGWREKRRGGRGNVILAKETEGGKKRGTIGNFPGKEGDGAQGGVGERACTKDGE